MQAWGLVVVLGPVVTVCGCCGPDPVQAVAEELVIKGVLLDLIGCLGKLQYWLQSRSDGIFFLSCQHLFFTGLG